VEERCAEFTLDNVELPAGINAKRSLPELESWVRNNAEG
jgi:CRISPR system Cascade subunit CasC